MKPNGHFKAAIQTCNFSFENIFSYWGAQSNWRLENVCGALVYDAGNIGKTVQDDCNLSLLALCAQFILLSVSSFGFI